MLENAKAVNLPQKAVKLPQKVGDSIKLCRGETCCPMFCTPANFLIY